MGDWEEDWPRIKDLPKDEQKEFERFLRGQTCPYIDGLPIEEQDGYYPWDYTRWKAIKEFNK